MADIRELRSQFARKEPIPNGNPRSQPFGTQFRVSGVVKWNGSDRRVLDGTASSCERPYRMWDVFGEYHEVMSRGAFDKTLKRNPDVAYLVNHRGVTMARTTNGSLELEATDKGLHSRAYLNHKRTDVSDLLMAIDDEHVTEMSFAFMIKEGEWNEDYTEFRIYETDLDRGDVSAVNFGANPHTSVKARQQEVIRDFGMIPRGAQHEALRSAGFQVPSRANIHSDWPFDSRTNIEPEDSEVCQSCKCSITRSEDDKNKDKPVDDVCPDCKGDPEKKKDCPTCGGSGKKPKDDEGKRAEKPADSEGDDNVCPDCKGDPDKKADCPTCGGTGKKPKEKPEDGVRNAPPFSDPNTRFIEQWLNQELLSRDNH